MLSVRHRLIKYEFSNGHFNNSKLSKFSDILICYETHNEVLVHYFKIHLELLDFVGKAYLMSLQKISPLHRKIHFIAIF